MPAFPQTPSTVDFNYELKSGFIAKIKPNTHDASGNTWSVIQTHEKGLQVVLAAPSQNLHGQMPYEFKFLHAKTPFPHTGVYHTIIQTRSGDGTMLCLEVAGDSSTLSFQTCRGSEGYRNQMFVIDGVTSLFRAVSLDGQFVGGCAGGNTEGDVVGLSASFCGSAAVYGVGFVDLS